MYRASTSTQSFKFPYDVSQMAEIQITYAQHGDIVLEKHIDDLTFSEDGTSVSFDISQREANLFDRGVVEIQARLLSSDGKSVPSKIVTLTVNEVLHDNILKASNQGG